MKSPVSPSFFELWRQQHPGCKKDTCGDPLWDARGLKLCRAIHRGFIYQQRPRTRAVARPWQHPAPRRQACWSRRAARSGSVRRGRAGTRQRCPLAPADGCPCRSLRHRGSPASRARAVRDLLPAAPAVRGSALLRMLLAAHRWQWAFTVRQGETRFASEPRWCSWASPWQPPPGARVWLSGSSSAEDWLCFSLLSSNAVAQSVWLGRVCRSVRMIKICSKIHSNLWCRTV